MPVLTVDGFATSTLITNQDFILDFIKSDRGNMNISGVFRALIMNLTYLKRVRILYGSFGSWL